MSTDGRAQARSYIAARGTALRGDIAVPGDKSVSHRAVMLGAIAKGATRVDGFLEGEDTRATAAILAQLGVRIEAPSEGVLWVRFLYDDGNALATDEMGRMYEDFKKSAYKEADIDTIKIVRQLASDGKLDASLLN